MGHELFNSIFQLTSDVKRVNSVIEELREMYPTLMHLIREDDSKNNYQYRIDSNTNEVLVADLIA
jgi:hypothetical protein